MRSKISYDPSFSKTIYHLFSSAEVSITEIPFCSRFVWERWTIHQKQKVWVRSQKEDKSWFMSSNMKPSSCKKKKSLKSQTPNREDIKYPSVASPLTVWPLKEKAALWFLSLYRNSILLKPRMCFQIQTTWDLWLNCTMSGKSKSVELFHTVSKVWKTCILCVTQKDLIH